MRNVSKKQHQDSNEMQSYNKPVGGNTMKSSTKDQAKGRFHKVKGTIKEIAGKDEKRAGKIQQKIGEIEKVVGK